MAKLELDAPAPHERAPGIPADLDALCVDLLRSESLRAAAPRRRRSARAPRARPTRGAVRARVASGAERRVRRARCRQLTARSSGRSKGRSTGAGTRVVVVEGEPGIGKSSVVQHFLKTLPESVLALSGRCYEQESVPFKGVDTMIDSLSEWLVALPDAEIDLLIAGGVRHLATVFPVLKRVGKIAGATRGAREAASASALREWALLHRRAWIRASLRGVGRARTARSLRGRLAVGGRRQHCASSASAVPTQGGSLPPRRDDARWGRDLRRRDREIPDLGRAGLASRGLVERRSDPARGRAVDRRRRQGVPSVRRARGPSCERRGGTLSSSRSSCDRREPATFRRTCHAPRGALGANPGAGCGGSSVPRVRRDRRLSDPV